MTYKSAIFDMDQTLVDIPPSFEEYWTKECFESFSGKEFSDSAIKDYLQLSIPERGDFLQKIGCESVQDYLDMWLTPKALDARLSRLIVFKDVSALLDLKNAGLSLGLVTAAPENLGKRQKDKLEEFLGVSDLFDEAVYIQESSFPKKPDASALNYCIQELSADKDSTFYCGNLDVDTKMASNAGVTPVLIDRDKDTNLEVNPKRINSLYDLLEL